ncbi:unnamed protein product, partial [Trypanosoma congolense IL3000]
MPLQARNLKRFPMFLTISRVLACYPIRVCEPFRAPRTHPPSLSLTGALVALLETFCFSLIISKRKHTPEGKKHKSYIQYFLLFLLKKYCFPSFSHHQASLISFFFCFSFIFSLSK